MIQPTRFRFIVRSPLGAYKRTVDMESSYVLRSGFKMSVTPEGICEEMTMTARNGLNLLDGTPGLGLSFADLLTVQLTDKDNPAPGDWTTVYYGQLRQGGNPHDYRGENMVFRGLSTKLRSTPTPQKSYEQMDAGLLARQLLIDTLASGLLGTVATIQTLDLGGFNTSNGSACVTYDPNAIPALGFTITLGPTNAQYLGALLDIIVSTGLKAGVNLRWGVRADGVLTLTRVKIDSLDWPAEQIVWKEPVAEVMYTGVLWTVSQLDDGTYFRYLSKAPEAALYGVEAKLLSVGTGLRPWKTLEVTPGITGAAVTTPGGADSAVVIRDYNLTTSLDVSASSGNVSVTLTVPAGGADRLVVDAQPDGVSAIGWSVQLTNGGLPSFRPNNPNTRGFTNATYMSDYLHSPNVPTLFPEGAVVMLLASPLGTGGASMSVREFRLEKLDTALLDGEAQFHYQIPEPAPGDLYRTGLLLPSEYAGKIKTVRPNGDPDYVANVSLWEYSVWADGGVRTAAKTGSPDDPFVVAQAALIKKGDMLATANALNHP